eukprot:TRINITY_DN16864_c0_g1_i1.p1 TRINITY_DN16864_c0_g1~~TRINITY_DN16864_c0_g1_i1.p1  ORF type:complete len:327 (+),score=28.81 TRINITY_DN16864_c0_g1_i1:28-981(+)
MEPVTHAAIVFGVLAGLLTFWCLYELCFSLRHDLGFFKRFKHAVLFFGFVKLLKDTVLTELVPVLPTSRWLHVVFHVLPTLAFYVSIAAFLGQMIIFYATDEQRSPVRPYWRSLWFRTSAVTFFVASLGIICVTRGKEIGVPVYYLSLLVVVFVCFLTVRVAYVQHELHFGSLQAQLVVPVVRRLRFVLPPIIVLFIAELTLSAFSAASFPVPFLWHCDCGWSVLWILWFNFAPAGLFILAFSAKQMPLELLRIYPEDATSNPPIEVLSISEGTAPNASFNAVLDKQLQDLIEPQCEFDGGHLLIPTWQPSYGTAAS